MKNSASLILSLVLFIEMVVSQPFVATIPCQQNSNSDCSWLGSDYCCARITYLSPIGTSQSLLQCLSQDFVLSANNVSLYNGTFTSECTTEVPDIKPYPECSSNADCNLGGGNSDCCGTI